MFYPPNIRTGHSELTERITKQNRNNLNLLEYNEFVHSFYIFRQKICFPFQRIQLKIIDFSWPIIYI